MRTFRQTQWGLPEEFVLRRPQNLLRTSTIEEVMTSQVTLHEQQWIVLSPNAAQTSTTLITTSSARAHRRVTRQQPKAAKLFLVGCAPFILKPFGDSSDLSICLGRVELLGSVAPAKGGPCHTPYILQYATPRI